MPAERIVHGIVASTGLAQGVLAVAREADLVAVPTRSGHEELDALAAAVAASARQIADLAKSTDGDAADVLAVQEALLADDELSAPARARIAQGASAATAWRAALDEQIDDYRAADDEYFRARAIDLVDLRDRVLRLLTGQGAPAPIPANGGVYVADDLTPSQFLEIDWRGFAGAALAGGSPASHVAMLARARGVPLVVALGFDLDELDGQPAILDANTGRLIVSPSPATAGAYVRQMADREAETAAEAAYLPRPAATADGRRIRVMINADEPSILDLIDPAHCDGIGVTRTEFLFRGGRLPDGETQFRTYSRLADWAKGRPVIVRTLDAGGDKPIPGVTIDDESDPFLGTRGLRLSLARPEIFKQQLGALARVAARADVRVLLPMVTVPEEFEQARRLLGEAVADAVAAGHRAVMPKLGMMVEVPAAAMTIHRFDADFLSIGSNDLVQYLTATSRNIAALAPLHDPRNPAVAELIGRVAAYGRQAGIDTAVCGDMAADPDLVPVLLDAGIDELSVSVAALARTKAAIARYGGKPR